MSEVERLTQRLRQKKEQGMRDFRVSWGPDAHLLTPEQRAREVNRLLDDIDARRWTPMEPMDMRSQRKVDVRELLDRLSAEKCDPCDLEAISE